MNTPKLSELQASILAAFETRFDTINRGLKATFRTLAQVLAGQLRLVYLYSADVQRNVFPDLADKEVDGGTLERFGRARLGRDPFPATAGIYLVDIKGVAGGVVRQGVIFKSTSGYNYSNEAAFTLTGATGQIEVRSLTTGLEARLQVGAKITATEPMLNVDSSATVNQETETPLNAEDIEDYRAKILQSFRIEAQGGASGDYRLWAADAQGVEKVYPFTGNPGQINLYIEATEEDSIDGNGTPSQTIIDNVEEVVILDPDTTKNINERGRLPMGVYEINYLPIATVPVSVNILGYTGNISEAQTLLADAFKLYFKTIRPYVAPVDEVDSSNLSSQRLIGIASDALPIEYTFTSLEMIIAAVPVSVRKFINGDIPIVGTITVTA
jgi:uncharacterized phage protein gp47/JayE